MRSTVDDDRPQSPVKVGAIVLAAGLSTRFGSHKPLAVLHGKTLIERVVDLLIGSKCVETIVVVTGHRADDIRETLNGRAVQIAHNADYASGEMLSSIKTGLRALPGNIEAAVVALCDQPMVEQMTIQRLVTQWHDARPRVLQPTFAGKRGHPIVLSAEGFEEILSLDANGTLKDYTSRYKSKTIELPVEDSAVVRDIDTPADLQTEMKRSASCTDPT